MKQHTEKEEWQLKYVSKACKQASLLLQFFMLALAITNAFAKSEISTQIVWLNSCFGPQGWTNVWLGCLWP